MSKQSKSSKRWLKEHFNDPFVKRAQTENLRSRAYFKLEAIDQKYHLIKPGMRIVDLGASPGSWSLYAKNKIGESGQVVALDKLLMPVIPGVVFIQGDFLEQAVYDTLLDAIGGQSIDLILCDIAPNMSGVMSVDQPKAMYLSECVFEFCVKALALHGNFVIKLFQGEGFDVYLKRIKKAFKNTYIRKPEASRDRSREYYLVGLDFQGENLFEDSSK
jgi:23S rRNA (uridine2552-2'-O)-methyltransferase